MPKRFTWDWGKAEHNRRKHGITFEEAITVFQDGLSFHVLDERHLMGESRYVLIGMSVGGRVLVVIYTDDGSLVRLISARRATKRERHDHEN